MALLIEILWAAMILMFLAGAITYAFQPHLGRTLLKRAAVLLAVIVIGPSLITSVLAQIPEPVLIVLGIAGSLVAYGLLAHSGKAPKRHHGPGASHAERHPHVPHDGGDE